MKAKHLLPLVLAIASVGSFAAQTNYSTSGTVTFSGTVAAMPCTIASSSITQTVNLPTVTLGNFTNAGDIYGLKAFNIAMTNCLYNSASGLTNQIQVAWSGTKDTNLASAFKGTGTATGFGVQVVEATTDSNLTVTTGAGTTIQPAGSTLVYTLKSSVSTATAVNLTYNAYTVATLANTGSNLAAGTVASTATVAITFP